jgi:hypothetical protein
MSCCVVLTGGVDTRPGAAMATSKKSTAGSREKQRLERVAAMRAEQQRRARRSKLYFRGGIGVLVLALIGGAIALVVAKQDAKNIPGVVSYSGLGRNHVTSAVKYSTTPPVGGNHNAVWLNCGIYSAPVANENAVHSMEHGAVWITYQPNLPAAQVTALKNAVRGKTYVVLSPYAALPAPVVATAWGKQLTLTSASDGRIAKFISQYAASPNAPEPGAACTGGTGTPTG